MKILGHHFPIDVVIFLILIPFISAFNYYLTYSTIQLNSFLLLSFTIDTLQGYAAWYAVRQLIYFLDSKIPYEKALLKRIIVQVIITTFVGLLIISLTTELASWIVRGKAASMSFYTFDLFIISIWFFVINGIYIGLHYYERWQTLEKTLREEKIVKQGNLLVKQGKSESKLSYTDIAGIYVQDELVIAITIDNKKFYLDESLDKLEKKLPTSIFFRLNRQYIVQQNFVSGFKKSDNGKLIVMLKSIEFWPSEITVSRTKGPAFKAWFRPTL